MKQKKEQILVTARVTPDIQSPNMLKQFRTWPSVRVIWRSLAGVTVIQYFQYSSVSNPDVSLQNCYSYTEASPLSDTDKG